MSIPSSFTPDKLVYLSSKYMPSPEDKFVSLNQLESAKTFTNMQGMGGVKWNSCKFIFANKPIPIK
jgi:hypothetical protein